MNWTGITAGGGQLEFQGDTSTETTGLKTCKDVIQQRREYTGCNTYDNQHQQHVFEHATTRISMYEIQHQYDTPGSNRPLKPTK